LARIDRLTTRTVAVTKAPGLRGDGGGLYFAGRADLLWLHNGDNAAVIWEMNGASILAAGIGSIGLSWHIANVGEDNADILPRNNNGALAVWTMNGFTPTSTGVADYADSA